MNQLIVTLKEIDSYGGGEKVNTEELHLETPLLIEEIRRVLVMASHLKDPYCETGGSYE